MRNSGQKLVPFLWQPSFQQLLRAYYWVSDSLESENTSLKLSLSLLHYKRVSDYCHVSRNSNMWVPSTFNTVVLRWQILYKLAVERFRLFNKPSWFTSRLYRIKWLGIFFPSPTPHGLLFGVAVLFGRHAINLERIAWRPNMDGILVHHRHLRYHRSPRLFC